MTAVASIMIDTSIRIISISIIGENLSTNNNTAIKSVFRSDNLIVIVRVTVIIIIVL